VRIPLPAQLRLARIITAIAGIALALPALAQTPVNRAAPAPIEPISGSLVIVGGGGSTQDIWDRFMQLAGGDTARIVYFPTASADPVNTGEDNSALRTWRERNPAAVLMHTRSRDTANMESFVAPLRNATGIWFGGGVQSRITDAYLGTKTEEALREVLRRGGVIGGTSAGAAIMTEVMITGGNPEATIGPGFGFLPGAVADQHFSQRNRQPRLVGVLAKHPGLVGFGIDEATALVVHNGRQLEVLGRGQVHVIHGETPHAPVQVTSIGQRPPRAAPAGSAAAADSSSSGAAPSAPVRPAYQADLIALHRAAQARLNPAFPAAEPPAPEVPSGSLVIVGGGGMPEGMWKRFVELAGGPDAKIVVIPTATGLPDNYSGSPGEVRGLQAAGATNVHVLHTTNRTRANSDETLLAMLRGANAVWFGGGRQWRLVDSYQNTVAHELMLDVLKRGGVIGGSSAGASIQGDYMARGNPMGPAEIMAPGYETGLGFLQGVAIDQHFTQRNRQPNMSSLMDTYPQILGIGIDERTAIIVKGSVAEVAGAGNVAVYDRKQPPAGERDHINLREGDRYDLKARRVLDRKR
jgi:cyanophycinase